MAKFDLKIVFDDVRGRDAALLNVILAGDRQAVALFRVFVTLVVALVSATIAASLSTTVSLTWGMVTGAILAIAGLCAACWQCIRAIRTANMALPGKRAEFWIWARREDIDEETAVNTYLEQSREAQDTNHKVNTQSAASLKLAKLMAVAAVTSSALVVFAERSGAVTCALSALRSLE
jgi:hypothetical protein